MMFFNMWRWWYTAGWVSAARLLLQLLQRQIQGFSVPILLRTLISPWKQTVNIAGPNTPIQVRLHWWVGNQVSRFIGFIIRVVTLAIALCAIAASTLIGTLILLSWFIIPLVSLWLFVVGVSSLWR